MSRVTVKCLEQKKWATTMNLPFAGKVSINEDGCFSCDSEVAREVINAMPSRFCNEADFEKMHKEVTAKAIAAKPIASNMPSPPLSEAPEFIRGLRESLKEVLGRLQDADKFLAEQEEVANGLLLVEQAKVEEARIAELVKTKTDEPKTAKIKGNKQEPESKAKVDAKKDEEKKSKNESDKKAATISKLSKMNKADLHDVITRANKPKSEWETKTNAELVKYIEEFIL